MPIKPILQIGHKKLKAVNKTIYDYYSPKLKQVIKNCVDTMRKNQLIGLAAPQIGDNLTVFVTEPRVTPNRALDQTDKLRIYINPIIIYASTETSLIYEGCGSFAKGSIFGPVIRPKTITVKYSDQNNISHQLTCDGILARVILHEYDHLNGIEFIEKISDYKLLIDIEFYRKQIKTLPEQIQASLITLKQES